MENTLKLADFAKQRNIARDTITQYIRRNSDMFTGHIVVDGKWMFIDEQAEKILDEKYPLPHPVEIVEDIETIKELSATRLALAKAETQISELQEKIADNNKVIAQAEVFKLLLEDKKAQLDEAQKRAGRAENEIVELRQQLESERAKTWWQKLINKN